MTNIYLQQLIQSDFYSKGFLSKHTFDLFIDERMGHNSTKARKIQNACPETILTTLTKCYKDLSHPDQEMETRLKVYVLLGIPWIGFTSVTHLMHLHQPSKYLTLDTSTWEAYFGVKKNNFNIKDYLLLLKHKNQE